jgi:hypothetical protein
MDSPQLTSGKVRPLRIPALFFILCLGSFWSNSAARAEDSRPMLAPRSGMEQNQENNPIRQKTGIKVGNIPYLNPAGLF